MHIELGVTKKKLGWLFLLRVAWIVATVTVLLIGFGTCLAGDDPCLKAGRSMQGVMLLLSFPSSVLFLLSFSEIYGRETIHYPVDYVRFWLGTAVVGYLQWFVAVPSILATPVITTLGLSPKARSKPASKLRRRHGTRTRPVYDIKHFDEAGKTPIERVLSAGVK
jgi:hypothetical protein